MNAFDKPTLTVIRSDVDAALASVAEKHGISIKVDNCTYVGANATFKLELACLADDGSVLTKEAEDFKHYAPMFGLAPEHLGSAVTIDGVRYTVAGLRQRAPKRPIVLAHGSRRVVASAELVKRHLV